MDWQESSQQGGHWQQTKGCLPLHCQNVVMESMATEFESRGEVMQEEICKEPNKFRYL